MIVDEAVDVGRMCLTSTEVVLVKHDNNQGTDQKDRCVSRRYVIAHLS